MRISDEDESQNAKISYSDLGNEIKRKSQVSKEETPNNNMDHLLDKIKKGQNLREKMHG